MMVFAFVDAGRDADRRAQAAGAQDKLEDREINQHVSEASGDQVCCLCWKFSNGRKQEAFETIQGSKCADNCAKEHAGPCTGQEEYYGPGRSW